MQVYVSIINNKIELENGLMGFIFICIKNVHTFSTKHCTKVIQMMYNQIIQIYTTLILHYFTFSITLKG